MKVGFISLGCSKNLIDTEVAIGHFKNNQYEIVNNPEKADIIVINTCGFIESAKEEAINTILEMAEYKKKNCKYLIAMGCLVQRYYDELVKALPEVDLFIKIDEYNKMWEKIEKLRKEIPDVTLRTSLIVGFPGETEKDFEELREFVKKAKFDKLGTFMYSKEEGTPAARLPDQIHGNTKKARYNKIMEVQQKISKENLEKKIGKVYEALIEDISFDGKYLIGRTKQDVPEEDGIIYIKNAGLTKMVNKFVNVEITDVKDYDLIGKLI